MILATARDVNPLLRHLAMNTKTNIITNNSFVKCLDLSLDKIGLNGFHGPKISTFSNDMAQCHSKPSNTLKYMQIDTERKKIITAGY